ncbi:Eco47II family restriction endonuclease [Runella sp.]|uniref:Eco47II family restriction endonuclease n=1 Tax=Runella sp. TaxID=1960881 RepID=UPI00260B23A2|nr:Eco47II family restriction endonuclease [Runella sp.]
MQYPKNITKKNFYSNKVDTIKLTFDAKFNDIDEEALIQSAILRQIDKSINNSIGTFHEQVLGGIKGFEVGNLSGFDIKAVDDTLFADIHYYNIDKHYEEAIFNRLAHYAKFYKKAKLYLVEILAEDSFCEKWSIEVGDGKYSHKQIYKISIDQFYALLSKQNDAYFQLYKSLPIVIKDFLSSIDENDIKVKAML